MEQGRVERGKILAKSGSGYTVASLDRAGIEMGSIFYFPHK